MANNKGFELPVVAKLDTSAAAIQELQNQLDKIGKKLKLTIGATKTMAKQTQQSNKEDIQKVKIIRDQMNGLVKASIATDNLRIQGKLSLEQYKKTLLNIIKQNEELTEGNLSLRQKNTILKKIESVQKKIETSETNSLKTRTALNKELSKSVSSTNKGSSRGSSGTSEARGLLTQIDIGGKSGQMSLAEQQDMLHWMLDEKSKILLTDTERLAVLNKIKAVESDIEKTLTKDSANRTEILTKEEQLRAKRATMLADLETYQKKFPDVYGSSKVKPEIESTIAAIDNMKIGDPKSINDADIALKKLKGSLDGLKKGMAGAQNEGKGFFKTIAADFGKFTMWMVSATLVMGPIRKIREAFDFVAETDKNLTNIGLVLGKTTKQLDGLATSYNKLAMEMGVTTSEVLAGATEWFRQGKNFAETEELLRSTMMLSKLGAIDSAQATEYLTSTLNGFKMGASQAVDVVDKLVAVDNAAATSVAELAIALQRSSNSASQAGVSIDELVGYVGTVSSVTRKSAKFGPLCYNT